MKQRTLSLLIVMFALLAASMHLAMKKQPDPVDLDAYSDTLRSQANWDGKTAPEFEIKLGDGSTFRLSEHVGKEVVILNFFATWCGPCKAEMPELNRFYTAHADKDVVLIGINSGEKPELVDAFIKDYEVSFPVGMDESGDIDRRYGVMSYPTTVLVGVDGKVQLYESGAIMNTEVTFKRLVEMNAALVEAGAGVTQENYLAAFEAEDYSDVLVGGDDEEEEKLEGRAKAIAEEMTCPCGCSHRVDECSCSTAEGIRKRLREGEFGDMTDAQIIKALNAEFCEKES